MAVARGVYNIQNRANGLLLDVSGNLPIPGIPIIQWHANGGQNQRWEAVPLGNDVFHLVVQMPLRQLLAVPNGSTSAGSHIVQWPLTNGDEQRWRMTDGGDGCFFLTCLVSDMVLDGFGNLPNPGTPVIQWPQHGGRNQQWRFIPA